MKPELDKARDYYKILGIPSNSSQVDIRKAFLELARTQHPDKNPGQEQLFKSKFQEITTAYDVLKDPVAKRTYDLTRPKFVPKKDTIPTRPTRQYDTYQRSTYDKTYGTRPTYDYSKTYNQARSAYESTRTPKTTPFPRQAKTAPKSPPKFSPRASPRDSPGPSRASPFGNTGRTKPAPTAAKPTWERSQTAYSTFHAPSSKYSPYEPNTYSWQSSKSAYQAAHASTRKTRLDSDAVDDLSDSSRATTPERVFRDEPKVSPGPFQFGLKPEASPKPAPRKMASCKTRTNDTPAKSPPSIFKATPESSAKDTPAKSPPSIFQATQTFDKAKSPSTSQANPQRSAADSPSISDQASSKFSFTFKPFDSPSLPKAKTETPSAFSFTFKATPGSNGTRKSSPTVPYVNFNKVPSFDFSSPGSDRPFSQGSDLNAAFEKVNISPLRQIDPPAVPSTLSEAIQFSTDKKRNQRLYNARIRALLRYTSAWVEYSTSAPIDNTYLEALTAHHKVTALHDSIEASYLIAINK